MDNEVYIVKCEDYKEENISQALKELLIDTNLLDFIYKGCKVAIKANLVVGSSPEKAIVTHPSLIYQLTKILIDKGCDVTVGDSTSLMFNEKVMKPLYKKIGLDKIEEIGGHLNNEYTHLIENSKDFKVVKNLDVSKRLKDADFIINFAKLKSHGMMSLSSSTKNMFGSVPGSIKLEYHYRYSTYEEFSNMLIDIQEFYKPTLHIVDGILSMEGNGPTTGTPRETKLLFASKNPYNLDLCCCKIMNLDYHNVPYIIEAMKRDLCVKNIDEIKCNQNLDSLVIKDYKNIVHKENLKFFSNSKLLGKLVKKLLETKPNCNKKKCIGCKKCFDICPAHAITMKNNIPVIDRAKCIKCFCCQEFCPVGSMKAKRTIISKILTK